MRRKLLQESADPGLHHRSPWNVPGGKSIRVPWAVREGLSGGSGTVWRPGCPETGRRRVAEQAGKDRRVTPAVGAQK